MSLLNWKDLKPLPLPKERDFCAAYVGNCVRHIEKDERKYFYIAWLMELQVRPTKDFDRRIYKFI